MVMVGVDRLSFSFPLETFDPDPRLWPTVSRQGPRTRWSAVEHVHGYRVRCGVVENGADGALMGWADFNPARVIDPAGWELLPAERALEAVPIVLASLGRRMAPATCADDGLLTRVDLARDFSGVRSVPALLQALYPLPRSWARRKTMFSDPKRHGGAQTVEVGNRQGRVRLYDKAAETGGRAPEGTVRWEAECHRAWLSKYGGMRCVGDLTPEACATLAEDRWEWSRMGAAYGGAALVFSVLEDLRKAGKVPPGFASWLGSLALGKEPRLSKATAAKYRRLQREFGLVVCQGDLHLLDEPHFRRLDWHSGREVIVEAEVLLREASARRASPAA
jgi:hypothetical protein